MIDLGTLIMLDRYPAPYTIDVADKKPRLITSLNQGSAQPEIYLVEEHGLLFKQETQK